MKKSNQSKKLAKALATTIFGVGFVTPLMFSNIAEAANFGAGGITILTFTADQIETYSAKNSSCTKTDDTTWTHNITDANCVMINGYRFKVVGNTTTAGKQILTLWSYNSTETGASKSFATDIPYNSSRSWGSSAAEAYNNSNLKTAMDGLLTTDGSGNPNGGELYDSKLTYVKYTSTVDTNVTDAYVWAPSSTEVLSEGWSGSHDYNFAIGRKSLFRSPADRVEFVWGVGNDGTTSQYYAEKVSLLRPALQILNQTPCVFTTKVDLSTTNGEFSADGGSDTTKIYELNSTAVKPAFAPATNGVTLDGTKIGITVTDSTTAGYETTTGLLTTETNSENYASWEKLNGNGSTAATSTCGISYMAQVNSNALDLKNVGTGDYTLKLFGRSDTAVIGCMQVSELADNAVQGLSKGSDGKIHMKVRDIDTTIAADDKGINNGVAVTLKGGAVVDLAGDASNAITLDSSGTDKTGKLNLGASTYAHKGTIAIGADGTLTVEGTGTLAGTVSGAGKVVIDGTISADANKFTQTGGVEVKDSGDVLTLTGTGNILFQTVSGAGKVVIDGTISAGTDKFTQTGGLEVANSKELTLTAGSLLSKDITNNGTVKFDVGSGNTVEVSSKITGGTIDVTSGLMKYTNANAIAAKTIIRNGAKLDPAVNLLNADTTVESGGELYISTGELLIDEIKGSGTTYLKADPTSTAQEMLTVKKDATIVGTLNGSGGTVDMRGGTANNVLVIGKLRDTINLKIDVDMSNFTADRLGVVDIDGATVNLSYINITKDITPTTLELPKTEDNKITYVTSISGTATYNVSGSATGSIVYTNTNNYKYTFTKGTTAGTLNYKVEAVDLTFKKFVEGTLPDYTSDPATLCLTDDMANTGTGSDAITMGTSQSNNAITVNLNGHNLTSAADSTITVNSGKTFNLDGGSTTAGTTDNKTNFSVAGTLAISGKTKVAGAISGAGTVTNSGELTIEDAAKVQVTGTDGIANTGTVNLGGATASTLGGKITGGVLNIVGDVSTVGTNLAAGTGDALVVSNGKTLTITGGNLARNITGTTGTTKFTGTSESTATIANKLDVNGGTLTINASNIDGTGNTLTSGILKLNGGQLDNAVTGTGTTEIIADTTLNANLGTAITVDATRKLTSSANYIGGGVENNGTVELTDGALWNTVTGGALNITGDVTTSGINLVAGAGTNSLTVSDGKILIISWGDLARNVTGTTGTTKFTGTSESTATIANKIDVNGGTLTINASNIDGTGNTVTSGTLKLNGGQLDNAVTGAGTTEIIADTTLNAKVGTAITVDAGKKLTSSADNMGGAVTNSGTVHLTGGALETGISGNGTTFIDSGKTVKIDGTYDLTGNQNLTINGTLDMTNTGTESCDELTVGGNLVVGTGGAISFGVDMSGVNITSGTTADLAETSHDRIVVTGTASGTLNMNSIAFVPQDDTTKMKLGDTVYLRLVQSTGANTISIANTVVNSSGRYKYTFSDAATAKGAGWVQVVKEGGNTLAEIIRGKGTDDKGAEVTRWSVTGDVDLANTAANQYKYLDGSVEHVGTDLGTLVARTGTFTAVELTIAGNGYNLIGGATTAGTTRNGITVPEGGTLNVENLGTISDFTDYFVKNDGTLNIKGNTSPVTTTLNSEISGTGTTNISINLTLDASATKLTQGAVTVDANSKLIAFADNISISAGITNKGTVELKEGSLAAGAADAYNKINGGNIIVAGNVSANASKLAGTTTVQNGKTLTLTGGDIGGNISKDTVAGTGALVIKPGAVTNTAGKDIAVAALTIDTGSLTTDANKLAVDSAVSLANDARLILTGTNDTLDEQVTGTGILQIGDGAGTNDTKVTVLNAITVAVEVVADGTLIINASNLPGAVTNGGAITLKGNGTLTQDIFDGKVNIGDGDGTTDKVIANVGLGDVTIASDGNLVTSVENVAGVVTNYGVLVLNGAGTLNNLIIGTGMTNIGDGAGTADVITANVQLGLVTIASDGTLITDANNLTGAVTNGGTLNVNGGTLNVDVGGNGTTVIVEDMQVNVAAGTDFTDGQNLMVNGTVDVSGDEIYDSIEVSGNLSGNGTYSFDISLAGVGANAVVPTTQHDRFVVAGNGSGSIKLGTIRLAGATMTAMENGNTAYFQLVKAEGANSITVGNKKIVTSDKHLYVFEQAVASPSDPSAMTSVNGWGQVSRRLGYSLAEIVAGSKGSDTEPASITGFVLTDNLNLNDVTINHFDNNGTVQDDLGTLKDNRSLTVDGGGYYLHGDDTNSTPQKNGMTVTEGSTLNLDNITEIANFKDYFVKNDGTVQINGGVSGSPATPTETVLKNAITDTNGDGSKGTLILDNDAVVKVIEEPGKIVQKEIIVKNGSTLVYNGDNVITETMTNNGEVEITGGTVTGTITGTGTTKTTGEIAVGEKGVVTFDPDLVGGNIANSGVITLKPNGADEDWKTGDPDHTDKLRYTITGGKVIIDGNFTDDGTHLPPDEDGNGEIEIKKDSKFIVEDNTIDRKTITGEGTIVFETDEKVDLDDKKIDIEVEFRHEDGTPGGDISISGEIYGPVDNEGGTTIVNGGILSAEINTGDTGKVIFAGDTYINRQQTGIADFEQGANTNITVPLSLLEGENGGIFTNLTKLPTIDDSAVLTITGCEKLVENGIYTLVRGDKTAITGTEILWKNIVVIGDGEVDYDLVYAISEEGGEAAIPGVITLKAIDNGGKMKEDSRFDDSSMLERYKEKGGEQANFAQEVKDKYRHNNEQMAMDAVNSITNFSSVAEINTSMAMVSAAVTDNIMDHVSLGGKPAIQREGYKTKNTATSATETMTPDYVEVGKADNLMPERLNKAVYDKEVWASYVHGRDNMDGMKAGSLSKSSTNQYNGTTVGVDLWSGAKNFGGMSLSYVDGTVNNSNSAANTRNKVKNYGVNFYHRQDTGNDSALLFNVGYIQAKNDISMNNLGYNITAEPKVESYNAGVRFEKAFKTGRSRVIPYAGVNYSFVKTGEYSNSWGERYQVDNQNLINVPVGLKWTGEFQMPNSVCTWRPRVEVGYNFNYGGRGNKQTILNSFKTTEFDTFDCGTYYVRAGMDFVYKNFTGGFGYNFSKSNHIRNNRWNVDVSWKF